MDFFDKNRFDKFVLLPSILPPPTSFCKTVNLVTNTLGWSRWCSAWTEEVTWYVTCWHYRSLALRKSCVFSKTVKRCSIDSTPGIELSCTKVTCRGHGVRSCAGVTKWGHVQGPRVGVTCRGHASYPEWSAFINGWSYNNADSLRVKHGCQLIVRLKAIKFYKGLLFYLSSSTSGLLLIAVTALFVSILLGL